MGLLTPQQRDAIESGEIREKTMMRKRIRDNFNESLEDIQLIIRYHEWIEGDLDFENFIDDEVSLEIVSSLLYMLDNEHIDENILYVLLESAEENWTIDGTDVVHGTKQELALLMFCEVFCEFGEDDLHPEPSQLDNWDEFMSIVSDLEGKDS